MAQNTKQSAKAWVDNPEIKRAALASGWDLTLLEAIIAVESGGDSLAVSSDNCVGLVQFRPTQQGNFDGHHKWGQEIERALTSNKMQAVDTINANSDPRYSVIYGGFVLQDMLLIQENYHRQDKIPEGYSDNLFMALRGYNGGTYNLRHAEAQREESRDYTARVVAYLDHRAEDEGPESSYAVLRNRIRRDAERVGMQNELKDKMTTSKEKMAPHARNSAASDEKESQNTGGQALFTGAAQQNTGLQEIDTGVASVLEDFVKAIAVIFVGIFGGNLQKNEPAETAYAQNQATNGRASDSQNPFQNANQFQNALAGEQLNFGECQHHDEGHTEICAPPGTGAGASRQANANNTRGA